MIERYSERLTSILDIHAPIIHRIVIPRPINAPWYTSSLHTAKRKRTTLERRWRRSRKQTDRVAYRNQCAVVAKQLSDIKQKYYSDKIIECAGDAKMLHSITNKLLIDQHTQQLPRDDDDTHLANRFCDYFTQKIDNIRNNFTLTTETEESLSQYIKFDHFRSVSTDEIRKIITTYNCELDPIPTWLLKLCVGELLPLLTSIINNSFESGVFPNKLKQALIRPLLKKHNLDPEEVKNYRPVSNLHFISKIIEKIVAQQLEEHISIHSLHDPLQSAYKSSHSTETAIIKITNDIITSIDRGRVPSWHHSIFQLPLIPWTMTSTSKDYSRYMAFVEQHCRGLKRFYRTGNTKYASTPASLNSIF